MCGSLAFAHLPPRLRSSYQDSPSNPQLQSLEVQGCRHVAQVDTKLSYYYSYLSILSLATLAIQVTGRLSCSTSPAQQQGPPRALPYLADPPPLTPNHVVDLAVEK